MLWILAEVALLMRSCLHFVLTGVPRGYVSNVLKNGTVITSVQILFSFMYCRKCLILNTEEEEPEDVQSLSDQLFLSLSVAAAIGGEPSNTMKFKGSIPG
jgi:hypothetical protein